MPTGSNSSYEHSELTGAMGYGTERKRNSSQQQKLSMVNGKRVSPQANKTLKSQDKHKTQNLISQPYLNAHHKLRECAVKEPKIPLESSENCQKHFRSKASKDDELVKYMSKIPGYLRQVEGNNVQEKALLFGVLDWNRLEKWKSNERVPVVCHRKASRSNSISTASRWPTISSSSPQRKHPSSCSLHPSPSPAERLNEGMQQSQQKEQKFHEFQVASINKTDVERKKLIAKVKSSDRSRPETNTHKGKWKESGDRSILEVKSLPANQDGLSLFDTASTQDGNSNARVKKEVNLGPHHCSAEPQGIELLLPKYSAKQGCAESSQFMDFRTSYDKQSAEADGSRFSDCFSSQQFHSRELDSELPDSRSLPATYIKFLTDVCTAPCADEIPINPSLSKVPCSEANYSHLESSVSVEPSMRVALHEQPATRGIYPSPNRRFSFGLGRLSRSFSFKDNSSSAVPQLSSIYPLVKSGPISSEAPGGAGNCKRDKPSTSGRGRSSPLRRLLDPFKKPKGTHSAESVHPSNGNSSSTSLKPMDNNKLLPDRKHEGSTFRALLQATVKNGLPFFKLIVENSSDILAAAVKNIPTMGKSDSSLIYAFYSVREIQKKTSSWMNQGSKNKSCGFGYDVIGQMKISNGYIPDANAQESMNLCAVLESVLYNVDPGQEAIKASEFSTNREIAAIVVRKPVDKANDRVRSDRGYNCTEGLLNKHCLPGCNRSYNDTTVILPGGLHGLPNEGAPSSLISRWKSGGKCDCGGWDMGCKLQILVNQDINNEILPCVFSSASDRLDLFSQGGEQQDKPVFSFTPLKDGLYSVEFDKSIPLHAAFSTCITVITSRKFYEILEMSCLSNANCFSEALAGSDGTKAPSTDQGQVPARYLTSPPASPVGRI